jgi:dTDP-4-dehydrorhamnose 3,5-epimerase
MRFTRAKPEGLVIIDVEPCKDTRGHFARTFCADEFTRNGLPAAFAQCSISFNRRRGTLRGLHFQAAPHPEGKVVRCTRGVVFDVAIDIDRDSPDCRSWLGTELSAANGRALWIPPGFAHGFVTLEDETELSYQMTESYYPELSRGLRWNDPAFGIDWPVKNPILSARDANNPLFDEQCRPLGGLAMHR